MTGMVPWRIYYTAIDFSGCRQNMRAQDRFEAHCLSSNPPDLSTLSCPQSLFPLEWTLRLGQPWAAADPSWHGMHLLNFAFALKVLALHKIWNLIVIVVFLAVFTIPTLLHALIAFRELAKGCERVGSELVQDSGHEFGELLVFAVAVDCESVGGDRCVNCRFGQRLLHGPRRRIYRPLGAEK